MGGGKGGNGIMEWWVCSEKYNSSKKF